jgi:hypothetical protein
MSHKILAALPSVHGDIWAIIFGHVGRPSWKQCNLVSRAWHQQLRPLLMSSISVDGERFSPDGGSIALLDVLTSARTLVRSLTFRELRGNHTQQFSHILVDLPRMLPRLAELTFNDVAFVAFDDICACIAGASQGTDTNTDTSSPRSSLRRLVVSKCWFPYRGGDGIDQKPAWTREDTIPDSQYLSLESLDLMDPGGGLPTLVFIEWLMRNRSRAVSALQRLDIVLKGGLQTILDLVNNPQSSLRRLRLICPKLPDDPSALKSRCCVLESCAWLVDLTVISQKHIYRQAQLLTFTCASRTETDKIIRCIFCISADYPRSYICD